MEEIKAGEYCRTDTGYIYIMKYFIEEFDYNKTKHSSNISDLIEIGDFINGKMCIDIEHYTRDDGSNGINFVCIGGSVLKENIKSIVTKEQFANAEYKLDN